MAYIHIHVYIRITTIIMVFLIYFPDNIPDVDR